MTTLDEKIIELLQLNDMFIYTGYVGLELWYKIVNIYNDVEVFDLCIVSEGIEKAVDLAIEKLSAAREVFYNVNIGNFLL